MPNVPFDGTLAGWRAAARALLAAGVAPDDAVWASAADAQGALALGGAGEVQPTYVPPFARVGATAPPRVPRRFLGLAAAVACHRDPERWTALYRVLWRLTLGGEPRLLAVSVDADVLRLTRMAKAVRRDVHKMHAFVRFRAAPAWDDDGDDAREYVAWFEPEHDVLAQAAAFFVRRFPNMRWAILTPRGTARWDGASLAFGPGVPAGAAPRDDSLEALWGVYYAHIFNPARLKPAAMRAEMPKKYWRNLPEARLIGALVRDAPARVRAMVAVAQRGAEGAAPRLVAGSPALAAAPRDATAPAVVPAARPLRIAGAEVRVGVGGWCAAVGSAVSDDALDAVPDAGPDVGRADAAWYPDDARTPEARLRHCAGRLPLVEIDLGTALPTRTVAALWAARTPAGCVFDVRAHPLLTGHPVEPRRLPRRVRDLLPPSLAGANRVASDEIPARVRDAAWAELLDALAPLDAAGKLGAVLLRLPRALAPSRAAASLLDAAAAALRGRVAAVELRHDDWLAPRLRARTLALLERLELAHTVVLEPPRGQRVAASVAAVTHPALAVLRIAGSSATGWPATGWPATGDAPAELPVLRQHVGVLAEQARAVHLLVDTAPGAERMAAVLAGDGAGGAPAPAT